MATFFVLTDNSTYSSKTEITDASNAEDAHLIGVHGALNIANDEIACGQRSAVVEVSVHDELNAELLRSAVMVSVAPLIVREGVDEH